MADNKIITVMMENLEYGGATTHLKTLIKNKAFSNAKFILVTNKSNKAIDKSFKINNKKIEIFFYNSLNVLSPNTKLSKLIILFFKPFLFLISILQMYNILKKLEFDILLANCGGYGDFRSEMASLIANKLLKKRKSFLLIHHCYNRPLFWNFMINKINHLVANCVDGIIFVSNATKLTIKKNTPLLDNNVNNIVIHNGVEIKKFSKKLIPKLLTHPKKIKIGMLSRIEEYKGQMDLVEGFNRLPKKLKDKCKVFLVGNGKKRDMKVLKKKINETKLSDKIKILNYLNEDSYKIINNFDLLVSLTRDFEAFGYSIAEALFVKTPVICTNVGGIKEFVNKKNAIILPPNNIDLIKRSLIDFISKKKPFNNKLKNGYKLIKDKFNSDIMSKKFIEYFSHA